MSENNNKNIGALVKLKTHSLLKSGSLMSRGLNELEIISQNAYVPEVISQIIILRKSKDWDEKVKAYTTLRKMGPSFKGWTSALKAAICDTDGWVRIFAAEALSRFSEAPDYAVPVLTALLEVSEEIKDYHWSRVAAGALGKYGANAKLAIPVLIKALRSEDPNVLGYIAKALGGMGGLAKDALPALTKLASNPNEPMRELYCEVIKLIEDN